MGKTIGRCQEILTMTLRWLYFLPLPQSSDTRNNAINWLMSVQGPDGCWNSGNILDTAFVLYSLEGTFIFTDL